MQKLHLAIVFAFLITASLAAQHVPGTKWKQRETANFIIIYPDTLSEAVFELAPALDAAYEAARDGLPSPHTKQKWPIVLTDQGMHANGFVQLAPRRSVWYATPGEDFTASSDWWMLLAHHEGRHMAQFDAADQGFTRFLHILFGEYGWGTGIAMGLPRWLTEGDAVVMETRLSEEGRGRDPLFSQELLALLADSPDISYFHTANPSFMRNTPNHYVLGYALVSWIRQEYGDEALDEIYRISSRIALPVIGINTAMRRTTGKRPKDVFREMADHLVDSMQNSKDETDWTPSEPITEEPDLFTQYETLFTDTDPVEGDHVYSRRETIAEAPYLVRIRTESPHTEEKLIRLPYGGRVSMARVQGKKHAVLRIAWDALRHRPGAIGASSTDILVFDLDEQGRKVRRFYPARGSRYIYPSLSPDGRRIAAVETPRGEECAMVVMDAETGEVLRRIELPGENAAHPSWSPDGSRLVSSLQSRSGRRLVQWTLTETLLRELLPPSYHTVKRPVYSADGSRVYFTSNFLTTEAVWTLDLQNDGTAALAARLWYGVSSPVIASDNASAADILYVSTLTSSKGERVVRVRVPKFDANRPSFTVEPGSQKPVSPARPNTVSVEEDYRPAAHALKVHSWGFDVKHIEDLAFGNGNDVAFNVKSQDVLGTFTAELGAIYEVYEKSPGAYANLAFTGIRPVFFIQSEYRYRHPLTDPFHQLRLNVNAVYPANLSRGGLWDHRLNISLGGGIEWNSRDDSVYPIVSASLLWYRLQYGSRRAIYPVWGWRLWGQYITRIDISGNQGFLQTEESFGQYITRIDISGNRMAGGLALFLPGGLRNTSLRLGGSIERRTTNLSSISVFPRGYIREPWGTAVMASADYAFPLGYPDLAMGSLIFVQRLRLNLYSDFAWLGGADSIASGGPFTPLWSTGATLTMDFTNFNDPYGMNIGFRFNWLWQLNKASFDVMLWGLPVFQYRD